LLIVCTCTSSVFFLLQKKGIILQNNNNKKSMLKGEVAIIKLYLNSDSDTIENIYVTYNEGSSVLNKAQGNDTIPTVVWIIGIIVIIFGINYLLGVLIILLRIKKGKNLLQWERTKLMEIYLEVCYSYGENYI
jgi:hypothetical protein